MAHEVKLGMDGMLINWLKDVGQSVTAGDIIAEFDADKATVEVEAGADGTLLELRAEAGDEIDEGSVIAIIGAEGEAPAPKSDSQSKQAEAPPTRNATTYTLIRVKRFQWGINDRRWSY